MPGKTTSAQNKALSCIAVSFTNAGAVHVAVANPLQGMTVLSSLQEPLAICQLYRSLGPAMVAKLHGDFAFVLHDSRLVRSPHLAGLLTKPCSIPVQSACHSEP